jgi:hypothetical protein
MLPRLEYEERMMSTKTNRRKTARRKAAAKHKNHMRVSLMQKKVKKKANGRLTSAGQW